jgi:hypothetical protein
MGLPGATNGYLGLLRLAGATPDSDHRTFQVSRVAFSLFS